MSKQFFLIFFCLTYIKLTNKKAPFHLDYYLYQQGCATGTTAIKNVGFCPATMVCDLSIKAQTFFYFVYKKTLNL